MTPPCSSGRHPAGPGLLIEICTKTDAEHDALTVTLDGLTLHPPQPDRLTRRAGQSRLHHSSNGRSNPMSALTTIIAHRHACRRPAARHD